MTQAQVAPLMNPHVVLIGSGIMSASVGVLLKCLQPSLQIQVYETTEQLSQESSHGWNNAGTGHAGMCELSYTPNRMPDGSVDIRKALEVFEQFEYSRQFWAFAVTHGILPDPREFVRPVPHLSFVHGPAQVEFLRARYQGMSAHPFFQAMQFTADAGKIHQWAPLLMEGRTQEAVAATRMDGGTDVNFGALARQLMAWLAAQPGCSVLAAHRVTNLTRQGKDWSVHAQNLHTRATHRSTASFVFIGAGGGSLPLLQKTGIPESRGIGGFPIGGQWLVCDNPEIIARHHAKVYGQALGAAPTMAVPHLDTRLLDGKQVLLFGPFAAWTTKFLHGGGSHLDLPRSMRTHNVATLLRIGVTNLDLIRYLRQQGMQSKADRLASLRDFYPQARAEDWRVIDAGIRVQAIKKTDGQAGIVHYGTEVITSQDRSIAALLGASPGASVSASIALDVIRTCLPALVQEDGPHSTVRAIFPTYGVDIKQPEHAATYRNASEEASIALHLQTP